MGTKGGLAIVQPKRGIDSAGLPKSRRTRLGCFEAFVLGHLAVDAESKPRFTKRICLRGRTVPDPKAARSREGQRFGTQDREDTRSTYRRRLRGRSPGRRFRLGYPRRRGGGWKRRKGSSEGRRPPISPSAWFDACAIVVKFPCPSPNPRAGGRRGRIDFGGHR